MITQEYLVNVIESLNVCNFLLVTKYLSVFNILSTFSGHKLHQILSTWYISLIYPPCFLQSQNVAYPRH